MHHRLHSVLISQCILQHSLSNPVSNYVPTVFLFTGWTVILAVGYICYWRRADCARCTKDTCCQRIGTWLSDVQVSGWFPPPLQRRTNVFIAAFLNRRNAVLIATRTWRQPMSEVIPLINSVISVFWSVPDHDSLPVFFFAHTTISRFQNKRKIIQVSTH